MFTDPAANLLLGNGFTSCTWPYQPCDAFWAGYPPLYPVLLAGWMRVFGFGPVAVRALDYVLIVVAVAALWLAVARAGLVPTRRGRLWLVALLLLGYGITFCYRSARVDCLGIALAGGLMLAYSRGAGRLRTALLVFLAALLPLTGLQLLAYAALMLALLALHRGRAHGHDLAAVATGLAIGAAALYALYGAAGVWPAFVHATVGARSIAGRGFAATLRQYDRSLGGVYKDPSFVALLATAIVLARHRRAAGARVAATPLGFALVVAVVIPAALFLTGVYPVYYGWMAYVPLAIGVCAALPARGARPVPGVVAGMALACALGLPLILAWTAVDWTDRDYGRVVATLDGAITADDRVFLDYPAYYAAKPRAAAVFTERSLAHMTAATAASIDVLIVDPAAIDRVTRALGGHWRATGAAIHSRPGRDAHVSIWGPRYELAVYRRAD